MSRQRILALLVVSALLGWGCGDDSPGATAIPFSTTESTVPPTSGTTTTTQASTTTATTAPATTVPPEPATTAPPAPTVTAPSIPPPLEDAWYHALVMFVDLGDARMGVDTIEWVWTGPADTEGYWTNDVPEVIVVPLAPSVFVMACPEDMTGSLPPMLYCEPDEFVTHSIDRLALWVHNGIEIGQNWRGESDIPDHNGQAWQVVVAGGEVAEVHGIWRP